MTVKEKIREQIMTNTRKCKFSFSVCRKGVANSLVQVDFKKGTKYLTACRKCLQVIKESKNMQFKILIDDIDETNWKNLRHELTLEAAGMVNHA